MGETLRRYAFRLYPNAGQEARMREALRFHCDLYNAALQERRDAYRVERKSITAYDQNRALTEVRHEHPDDYGRWSCAASQATIRRLDKAFKAFFRRVKAGQSPGFPRFKSIHRYPGWDYSTYGAGWKLVERPGAADKSRVSLYTSDIGTIRMRGKVRGCGAPRSLTIQHKDGRWYASVVFEKGEAARKKGRHEVGIDWGTSRYMTGVTEESGTIARPISVEAPNHLAKAEGLLKQAQRELSRKKRGSRSREKARKLLASRHAKVARKRQDFIHQTTHHVVRRVRMIASENLSVQDMVSTKRQEKEGLATKRRRALNRAVYDSAPATLFSALRYKAEEAGVAWREIPTVEVAPTQTCAQCGKRVANTLKPIYECSCGWVRDRKENAALVMLRWARAHPPVEDPPGVEGGVSLPMKREVRARKAAGGRKAAR